MAIDGVEVLDHLPGGASRIGHDPALQVAQLQHYALDRVHAFFLRPGLLAPQFARAGLSSSSSRYLGLALVVLIIYGLFDRRALGSTRRSFLFVLALLPLSAWLAFGPTTLWRAARDWFDNRLPADVPAAVFLLSFAVIFPLSLVLLAARVHLAPDGRRGLLVALVTLLLFAAFATTAPLPWLIRVCFFLRDLRNPEWFSVALATGAAAAAGGMALAGLAWRLRESRWRGVALAGCFALCLLDVLPTRGELRAQFIPRVGNGLEAAFRAIAADPGEGRVLPVEGNVPLSDLGYIWHRKSLAWDFRDYTAPAPTARLMQEAFAEFERGDLLPAASLAGLAHVRYLADIKDISPDLPEGLPVLFRNDVATIYLNPFCLPFVRSSLGPGASLSWARPAPEKITITYANAAPASLVIAESFHPGWVASVDGVAATVRQADRAFLGVEVPAGSHLVELRFPATTRRRALRVLSLGSLALALLVLLRRPAPRAPRVPA